MSRTHQINVILPLWLAAVKAERGPFAHSNNERWIRPFIQGHGERRVGEIGPRDLLAYRTGLQAKHKAGTVNAYTMTAKRLIQWAAEMEMRAPIMLTGVRPVQDTEERVSKVWTPEQVNEFLNKANRYNRQVYLWCAIQYLGLMRPSEVQTLVLARHGLARADKITEGVYQIIGKTTHKSKIKRTLIVPPEAEALLAEAQPIWTKYQCFWQAANSAMDTGPHRFRHSSMNHLSEKLGVEGYPIVRLLAGHYSDVKVTMANYTPPHWAGLRKYGSMLAANVALAA